MVTLFDNQDDKNQLVLTPERVMCPMHGAVFRGKWPLGYSVFAVEGLKRLQLCKSVEDVEDTVDALHKFLSMQPLCCRLATEDPDLLMDLYKYVNSNTKVKKEDGGVLFPEKKCNRCRNVAPGAPHKLILPLPGTMEPQLLHDLPHLCLTCVCGAPVVPVGVPMGGPGKRF